MQTAILGPTYSSSQPQVATSLLTPDPTPWVASLPVCPFCSDLSTQAAVGLPTVYSVLPRLVLPLWNVSCDPSGPQFSFSNEMIRLHRPERGGAGPCSGDKRPAVTATGDWRAGGCAAEL